MRDHLHLLINGQPTRIGSDEAFVTLADYLRKHRRLTGTKVVCAEGDCGACTVLVGRVDGSGSLKYSAVNSCIQLMCQLDATHVVTIEGLTPSEGSLNPIQQSMVACHGTQCGFCTPGFVVALYDLLQEGKPCDDTCVRRGLVGNLCRCTGYDSIVRAALQTDRSGLKRLDELFPAADLASQLASATSETVRIDSPELKARVYKPVTLEQAVWFRRENPDTVIVSGASDLGVLLNKRVRGIHSGMILSGIREMAYVRHENDSIIVGGSATLTQLEQIANEHLPALGEYLAWFGSPLIKNAGTLAGNLATASPIGDSAPPLFVLDAEITLANVDGARAVPMEQFITGYRKTAMMPDELISHVRIPLPKPDEIVRFYKVSRRKDLDISTFNAAFWMKLDGRTITELRIAFGAVGPTVLRMKKTEAVLRGKPATLELFEQAAQAARDEVTPISDVRGTEAYRRMLSHNALLKFYYDAIEGRDDGNGSNGHPGGNGSTKLPTSPPREARVSGGRQAPAAVSSPTPASEE